MKYIIEINYLKNEAILTRKSDGAIATISIHEIKFADESDLKKKIIRKALRNDFANFKQV